ncbi:MAG: hypothetical protein HRU38_00095 [Saccharospirillaceae bacterium]|nr:hypothetical protein [Pseudomonadales bacterium]NRB77062.1 hypothetical protein [Saccharospirillaceae bacterium]
MSSYSDILDELDTFKSSEQYAGFNPLSLKKTRNNNVIIGYWFLVVLLVSCLTVLMYVLIVNKEAGVVSEEVNLSQIPFVKPDENNVIIDYTLLEKQILLAKLEVELLLSNQESIEKEKGSNGSIKPLINLESDNKLIKNDQVNISITKGVNNKNLEEDNVNLEFESSFLVNAGATTITNKKSISNRSNIYNMNQLLKLVKSKQFNKALEYSVFLNDTQKLIIQAKVYEQTDVDKSIVLYQQLITNPNSPIEYVLKLAILNEKMTRQNQALYYYQLFKRHNTGSNQDVILFVNNKISILKSNRGKL